ncbi:uncharacterized protein MELLADRAFT_110250 [Melampsora larici-populina 98AG31]|uniref:Uncharacterized protein n=1 Tax=Melampsora larici-populina (strain 98AG31 / pathotype 3-4-7) TaxID=747676 RepID=F4RZ57_MELLP|nr:uncharacterized protein MELLADRAFT_110250 [Melampsora larici-populina 98AG31]EGG02352.1 hypothetical protein MELLADRAFT_110250 [Melampsora larici-populina 98AG31]
MTGKSPHADISDEYTNLHPQIGVFTGIHQSVRLPQSWTVLRAGRLCHWQTYQRICVPTSKSKVRVRIQFACHRVVNYQKHFMILGLCEIEYIGGAMDVFDAPSGAN